MQSFPLGTYTRSHIHMYTHTHTLTHTQCHVHTYTQHTHTQWSEIQDYLTEPTDKPVVLNRSSSTNSINPFGSTFCYGHHNVIFEVQNCVYNNLCIPNDILLICSK